MDIHDFRKVERDIDEIFLKRWSPRAFTGENIPDEILMSFFEAARWAPSSGNNQPWRFIFAKNNTPAWTPIYDLLAEGNRPWCAKASVLVVMISKNTFDYNGKPARTHSYDTGAAWENLALQVSLKGWYAHGMEGFDYQKAREVLGVPDDHSVEAMCAIGRLAPKETLPEKYQSREFPSDRKPLNELVFEGRFP